MAALDITVVVTPYGYYLAIELLICYIRNMKLSSLFKAFAIVELLGAVAVVATIATISVISVKDTVAAGQRAATQRELQNLNTALQNFKSAGGVIPPMATVSDAVSALMTGTDLVGGVTYAPLSSQPALETIIGGVPYSLAYDSAGGFSAVPTSGSGEIFEGGGTPVGAGEGGEGVYPFDITDSGTVAQALVTFAGKSPGDPDYQSYINAFNSAVALNTLPPSDLRPFLQV